MRARAVRLERTMSKFRHQMLVATGYAAERTIMLAEAPI
jgi:hypothetical protein